MSGGASKTPESLILLDLKSKGLDEAAKSLETQLGHVDKIEQSAARIAGHFDRTASSVGKLAGLVGGGVLLNGFMQLEQVANRIAVTTGSIATGPGGYRPMRDGLRAAGIATGVDSRLLGGAIASLQGDVGGSYLDDPATRMARARSLGVLFGQGQQAYGIAPGQLASILSPLELFGRSGVGQSGQVFAQLATQARMSGMEGQTPLFAQTVAQLMGALGGQHPAMAGPWTQTTLGAMYGAVSGQNQAFKNPGVFAAGVAGVDAAVTGSYANPRMAAVLKMAGVDYWQARGGLAGKGGRGLAQKLIGYGDRVYGKGSVEEDLFFRSQFGDVSADMLRAFSRGQGTYEDLLHGATDPHEQAVTRARMGARAAASALTPQSRAQSLQERAQHATDGPLGAVAGFALGHPIESILGYMVGKRAVGLLGRRGFGALKGALGARAAGTAGEEAAAAAADVAATRAAGGLLGPDGAPIADYLAGRGGAAAAQAAGGAGRSGLLAKLGLVGRIGSGIGIASLLAEGADALGLHGAKDADPLAFLSPDTAGLSPAQTRALTSGKQSQWLRGLLAHTNLEAQHRFGKNWMTNPDAQRWALDRVHHPRKSAITGFGVGGKDAIGQATQILGQAFAQAGTDTGGQDTKRFERSVQRFDKAIDRLLRTTGPHNQGSAYHGGAGSSLDAAGAWGAADQAGASMVLARMMGAGAGAGSGAMVSMTTPNAGPSSGQTPGGGGWKPCTLTWYDPALGGINSSHGQADPHSKMANGHGYQAGAMTCAAPSSYAMGTQIAFSYQGKSVTCEVTDRGGAITGNHFDLSRGAASHLGMTAAGRVQARFRVASTGARSRSTSPGQAGSASGGTLGGNGQRTFSADHAWLTSPAGGGSSGGGAGGSSVTVNIDGRKFAEQRALTRGRV